MTSHLKLPSEATVERELVELLELLIAEPSFERKVFLLENFELVEEFFKKSAVLASHFSSYEPHRKYILYSLLAIGQGEKIFKESSSLKKSAIDALVDSLLPVEQFYREIGGIIGYHLCCLRCLKNKRGPQEDVYYHPPKALDISKEIDSIRKDTIDGIRHLDLLAELYPLGGAADRLSLFDEETGQLQIASTLEFCQKTLLERLIEDLQGREFLHYKLFNKQVSVPTVMMTSAEKNGDIHIRTLLNEKNWFGRKKENFFLFSQPLVPAMNTEGEWCMLGPGRVFLKPGGHGVIWKLAVESKGVELLQMRGKEKILVRQINNLIAGIDYGLLAFIGIGFSEKKDFGFASCPREEGVCEGVNVVVETKAGFSLTNIEYCEKELLKNNKGLNLSNTNILLVDLAIIEKLLKISPFPGLLVNPKKIKYKDQSGEIKEEEVIRLESTMQNLADNLIEKKMSERTFITSNIRKKTISTIKKEFAFGSSLLQTPEQCFLDFLENAKDLLTNHCHFKLPPLRDARSYFYNGPSFLFFYHPSLGPLYQIIAQKLRGGRLAMGSELRLQISELECENLDVDGSLHISTEAVMGHRGEDGVLIYSENSGKCTLKNVKIRNSGINREASRCLWKNEIIYREKCEIVIEEGGEFHAENVILKGNFKIHVPKHVRMSAKMNRGKIEFISEALSGPTWFWKYTLKPDYSIVLEK